MNLLAEIGMLGGIVRILLIIPILAVALWLIMKGMEESEERDYTVPKLIFSAAVVACIIYGLFPVIRQGGTAGAFTVLPVAACGIILGILWAPTLGNAVAVWIGTLFTGGSTPPDPAPQYSIALTQRQRDHASEAARLVQAELAKFPHDVRGHMMLADIQAQDLKDVQSAEITLLRLCNQPGHAHETVSAALHTLADYHLKLAQDVDAARRALETIRERFPETEFAQRAAQRIAHLGTTEEWIKAAEHDHGTVTLKPGARHIGLLKPGERPQAPTGPTPDEQAAALVAQLEKHPFDNDAREELARIYAENFQRLDLAGDQLEQLIAQPGQPEKHVAHWLQLLAELHLRHADDIVAADAALARIEELYPGTHFASQAAQRRARLGNELRKKESRVVILGSYEKDLGLKQQAKAGSSKLKVQSSRE